MLAIRDNVDAAPPSLSYCACNKKTQKTAISATFFVLIMLSNVITMQRLPCSFGATSKSL